MDVATGPGDRGNGSAAWTAGLESPFAESPWSGREDRYAMPDMLAASLTPFADGETGESSQAAEELLRETFGELRDEAFHEAVSFLAEETEGAVEDRFLGEGEAAFPERERYARSYLAPVQFEADQYLASLEAGLAEVDPSGMSAEALEELLGRYDPPPGELSPASEQFIGGLVKKAKGVVRKVANVAKKVGKLASPLLIPMLKKLRALVRPLLERVLKFAIGKLPVALQPKARILADRILGKVSAAAPAAPAAAPSQATDTQELADSFDLALAEAVTFPGTLSMEEDRFGADAFETIEESDELAALAEARAGLVEGLASSGDPDGLAPHIEQFAPLVLAALRTGISIVGRPKVVSFIAGYLAKMIKQWVGAQDSRPLSQAIVDAGLKMITLEAENAGEAGDSRSGSVALASVIEDTVRRLAEAEDYLFEDQELTAVAVADAFAEAAATYLPQDTIRQELQLAPSLGGMFVTQRPGRIRSFAKYSRVPEVAISARAADSLPAFNGASLGAAVRAAGGGFPLRARMHIFQARPGATVAGMMRHGLRNAPKTTGAFPLTRRAAGVLLREPGLGSASSARHLRSSRRIGAGQRLYVLEPLDQTVAAQPGRAPAPGRAWLSVNAAKKRVTLGFYLSENDAQMLAGALRAGRGHGEILRKLLSDYRGLAQGGEATGGLAREDGEAFEDFATRVEERLPQRHLAALRQRIAAWAMPALSTWLRAHPEEFMRAAAHPDPGVRLRVRLSDVPGIDLATGDGAPGLAALERAMRGKPRVDISVTSGSQRR